jgi:hypothetical protein
MPETIPYLYTSREEVESIFGQTAVSLRLDDDETGGVSEVEDDLFDDVIDEATDEINIYCHRYYAADQLYQSAWVRRRCSWIAAALLSERRGNPGQFASRIATIYAMLERIRNGTYYIPRLPYSADLSPGMINTVIDDRFPRSKNRVQADQSVGGTDQHIDIDNSFYVDDNL